MPSVRRRTRKSFRPIVRPIASVRHTARAVGHTLDQQIVLRFLEILNTIKLYHWKTHSYATHKATDELHGKIAGNVDTFVETMLGKGTDKGTDKGTGLGTGLGSRINLTNVKSIPLKDFNHVQDFKREMVSFINYLVSLNNTSLFKMPSSSDLITIRDELLQDMNQFLYLLSFS